ncbi:MAG: UDP-N-acetylmuramate dehydrogenase [Bacteroidetes bacterium]|nr:UDP-N-acetylmuramate dehydrogenase [Bacteroidota bacterium]
MQHLVSLLPYNTFGIDVSAAHFTTCQSVASLKEALKSGVQPILILGGGSNILFTKPVDGLVIRNEIEGMEVVRSFENRVWVKVGGGVLWHDFVQWAVKQDFGGVENLSLIPGTVGAAPVQNIGAYGVELKDVFVKLEAVSLETGKLHHFSAADCAFAYRDSYFKRAGKNKFCITSVTLTLSKKRHRLNLSYGDILRTLQEMGVKKPEIADVSRAVVHIRSSKLPDPAKIGNCGSFFKNPEVERPVFESIRAEFPNLNGFDLPNGKVKIPAGWLIEQCGWKGKRVGNTGAYEKQALVLVNYGGAKGAEVKTLASMIIDSVKTRFGVNLEAEVNIL